MERNKRGLLIVLSGPSGAGKGTLLKDLMERNPNVMLSISATTRKPRPGEQDGVHYHFLPKDRFTRLIARDGLLEYAEYCGNYYGTPRDDVEQWLEKGRDVILEIEVQGAAQVLGKCPDAVSIFIMPPSMGELEKRLRRRDTEDEEMIRHRLSVAREELNCVADYQYVVFNGQLEDAVDELNSIIKAEKLRLRRMKKIVDEVLLEC